MGRVRSTEPCVLTFDIRCLRVRESDGLDCLKEETGSNKWVLPWSARNSFKHRWTSIFFLFFFPIPISVFLVGFLPLLLSFASPFQSWMYVQQLLAIELLKANQEVTISMYKETPIEILLPSTINLELPFRKILLHYQVEGIRNSRKIINWIY
mgnify:CR=1 FL=1